MIHKMLIEHAPEIFIQIHIYDRLITDLGDLIKTENLLIKQTNRHLDLNNKIFWTSVDYVNQNSVASAVENLGSEHRSYFLLTKESC